MELLLNSENIYICNGDQKTMDIAFAKTKMQISFAVTAKLISDFVFAKGIVQCLYFLNPKFTATSHH